jgi:hypothetical protein
MGFKLTGHSGMRRSGGGGHSAGSRVNAGVMNDAGPMPVLRKPAFVPDTPQESTFDSNSPRLGGLEKGH